MNSAGRIETGKIYSLAELFNGDNKIVIPDLQRDYCWGKDAWIQSEGKYSDLVSGFVTGLFELYRGPTDLQSEPEQQTMGLIYGYEQPKGRIQICDGQQRLTTLFLLLGYINIKAAWNFSDYIISPQERKDDFEPRLIYAIRESTLYFLSDLTKEVFVENKTMLEELLNAYRFPKKQGFPAWYFRDYELDTSIQNMLAALDSIDKVAQEHPIEDWNRFGLFLLNKIQFLYYDMGSRPRGEETYIIINTTGEPLSPAENIKPIVVGFIQDAEYRMRIAKEWEEREEWFWQNRGKHKTSDAYSYRFLVWYWQIGLLQNKTWKGNVARELNPRDCFLKRPPSTSYANGENASVERWEQFRSPETIHHYFQAFQRLVELVAGNDVLKAIFQSVSSGTFPEEEFRGDLSDFFDWKHNEDKDWRLNMILPAIAYLNKFPNATRVRDFIARLRKNFFDLWHARNPFGDSPTKSGSYVDWRHVIQIVEKSKCEEDVLVFDTIAHRGEFKNIPNVVLNNWVGQSEIDRQRLANLGVDVAAWEGHRALMGDLTPVVVTNEDTSIDLVNTTRRWKNLQILSACIENRNTSPDFIPEVANWYRLFRVLKEIIPIRHQYQTPWNLVGCYYSRCYDCLEANFTFMKTTPFARILAADDLSLELRRQCAAILQSEGLLSLSDTITATQLLKLFLFAKTLCSDGKTLSFYNDYPISVDTTVSENRLSKEMPLSWGNLVCRYGYKRGWRETGHKGMEYLDTSLMGAPVGTEPIPCERITEVSQQIESRIKLLLDGQ